MTFARPPTHEHHRLTVDAHVHFHQRRLVEPTLDAAARNFARVGQSAGPLLGALLLAEPARERVFEQISASSTCGRWQLYPVAGEPQTIIASSGECDIAIVCGRQVRCALGLEAIALGTTAQYTDGRELHETLDQIRADGALAVVPWGFGKWMGRAGGVIREVFSSCSPDCPGSMFAGDNGGRLHLWGMPRSLKAANRAGFTVLPGTDPFPFAADYRRVGAFGFVAEAEICRSAPWRSLKGWLDTPGAAPKPYGRALNPLQFVLNQGWMQIRKRVLPDV